MKSILLTTTAIVAFAGAAAADGHISIGWSGTATAGVAREGGSDATAGGGIALLQSLIADFDGNVISDADLETAVETYLTGLTSATSLDDAGDALRSDIADDNADLDAKLEAGTISPEFYADAVAKADVLSATVDAIFGADDAVETGEFDTYAEINATVTGSVATDNGLTLTAAMSVDAGTGYDFADDDGFDSAKTNGVGFDNVTLDAGTFGTLKFAPDDIAHLVDDDDDGSADVIYTNDFGVAKVSFALDIDTDSDVEANAASWAFSDGTLAPPANAVAFYDTFATTNTEFDAIALDVGGVNDEDDFLTYTAA
uniref:hypothetical protein n=1 Tax=Yoonia sp. TaxID=2212373 RepID=UPI0025F752DA